MEILQKVLNWIGANWMLICAVAFVLNMILNRASEVWHKKEGVVRWLYFFSSLLSPLGSKGQALLKIPGLPERRPKEEPPSEGGYVDGMLAGSIFCLILLVLLLIFGNSGCASTTLGKLSQLQATARSMREAATIVLDRRCRAVIPDCPPGGLKLCKSYQQCDSVRDIIYGSAAGLQTSISAAVSLAQLGKTAEAEALMKTIADGVERFVQQLVYYKVIGAVQTLADVQKEVDKVTTEVPIRNSDSPASAPAGGSR